LVSLLRIADRLDSDHRQIKTGLRVHGTREDHAEIKMRRASDLILWEPGAVIKEKEFGCKVQKPSGWCEGGGSGAVSWQRSVHPTRSRRMLEWRSIVIRRPQLGCL
jgi:hypothetical protein